MKTINLFAWVALTLLLLGACQPEADLASVNAAKAFFENQASTLSLPLIDVPQTKSTDLLEIAQSVYPAWEKAIISEVDGRTIVEVPLSGAVKVVGAIVTIDAGTYDIHRATAKSYLVFDFKDANPDMYVETFLQKGKKCTMTAGSDRERVVGVQILSDMDGHVFDKTGFENGKTHTLTGHTHKIDITRIKDVDYFGYRIAYAFTETKGGCPGYQEYLICPACFAGFWGNPEDPELECPYCGHQYSDHGDALCAICGHPLSQCICGEGQECPPCGQPNTYCNSDCSSSPYCTCDGGLHD